MRALLRQIRELCPSLSAVAWALLPVVFLLSGDVLGEDSYLDQLEVESQKLTDRPVLAPKRYSSDAGGEGNEAENEVFQTEGESLAPSPDFDEDLTWVEFEEELKSRFLGSFTFYKKLPQHSREEIYHGYLKGNAIKEIRKKVMNRYLHSR